MFKAVFWDMDGTLVDTEPAWGITTYELSELMGRRIPEDVRAKTVGGSFRNTVRICADYADITLAEADYDYYRRFVYTRMNELFDDTLRANPGVDKLLQELAAHQIPMLVTTNTERSLADRAIAAVGSEYFVDSITGDEVAEAKPAPDMYLEAARRVGAAPAECLVFEDSYNGMLAAVRAGCMVIGLPEESVTPPPGVVRLADLHGAPSFSGVTLALVQQWFSQIYPETIIDTASMEE